MQLQLNEVIELLNEHQLLKKVTDAPNVIFKGIAYDSRKVTEASLFFCKGAFKPDYLSTAKKNGATAYMAEAELEEGVGLVAIIVTNIQKAMALISAAFYDFPQNQLFIIAYTGTKGKTTSSYFTRNILKETTSDKTALFSTIDRIIGPKPEQEFKSNLTTPESLDLFHDMREAVDSGMTHLVMEVSSQAYKKERVYGLHFDVGVFLNITPDHIGPTEHPNFADYLHCKLQLLVNSKICVINAETDHLLDVYQAAKTTSQPEDIYLFAHQDFQPKMAVPPVDYRFKSDEADLIESQFEFYPVTPKAKKIGNGATYELNLPGNFNESNAVAAAVTASLAGASQAEIAQGLRTVHVPGRMESLQTEHHGTIYADYAHNYASMKALLSFLESQQKTDKVIVVVGSPGNKGVSRRAGFAKVLSEYADVAFLTTDDPSFEDPLKIAKQIDENIDHKKVNVTIEIDRPKAIRKAIELSTENDIVVLAGKGDDAYQKVRGVDTPYPTDMVVAKEIVRGLKD
ncbi:UDP-N-acetylmuramoyl-L-alanyl-D-glutamate--2,6-diaminopimelate ligase [Loigolactobacillus backii]|uniref:UDP-N-acetylmuramyl-tripeptide synthetase n=1 Tax=Loigolactobacillus backii TaxID=375175 RepID=A0A192GZK2_9LACO|nr:UDP-N-acetylmuramoyl-L-alanyl-D-glutamate--2,6-diaminopimelate ligase [Loigolactobacillus backii]ANK58867.1 UDP-N-acetylmuramoyl-L-alanyl-D-glutamate--2,6-diaminopimelate ligase [Loigolactobacillus backii]ANK61468.1 UDP-N-acetylmuramoyl-L-alanyl-D-glutamate--2,6-diaminopimelate ligase [Loigolactobacillus backii]ANK63857.1 UDP-N-acetylmuramoyl-L-alanyl-D-glutamate--2,6-diaminopimelate ligase [Loigolactobacillus backii]ANK66305.1 UDP-N-acetylmuramoyl-L-alanyl-D-glutamate--2,6-diaminopimelate l